MMAGTGNGERGTGGAPGAASKRGLWRPRSSTVWTVCGLLAALLVAPAVQAQGAGAFARLGLGARSVAFPAQVADRSGYASPFLNPALAPFQPAQGVELTAGALAFDRSWESVQVASPLQPRSGFAAGVVHLGVDNIDGRDASGRPTDGGTEGGTFESDEYAFFATFGTRVSDRVSAGVGLRLYRNQLLRGVRAPTAIGISLGGTARLSDRLSAGLSVDDLFARYEWSTSGTVSASATDYFPTRARGGLAYSAGARSTGAPRVTVAAEAELAVQPAQATRPDGVDVVGTAPSEGAVTLDYRLAGVTGRVGAEGWATDGVALRLGLDRIGAGAAGELRPSAGFGIEQRFDELDLRVDYAVVVEPYGSALMHVATVRLGL